MNALKKVAALLVVAVMLLQIPAFAQAPINDVIGQPCETAVRLVSALGIMQGDGSGNFSPDADITRAEFAQILMKMLKLDAAVEGYTPTGVFSDVPASNVFAKAIELGVSMGAIKGVGDGKFDPDGKVTGEQAIKMLIYAVGYEMEAEANGGYPAGYSMVASSKGMLKGIERGILGQAIKRSDAVIMVYNTLHIDILKKVSFGGTIRYEARSGVNLMTDKHEVFKFDGIIKANSTSTLWVTSSLKEGQVEIETTTSPITSLVLDAGDTDIENQLGRYVRLYYLHNNDEYETPKVVSYEVMAGKNNVVEIDLSNIEIDASSTTQLKYWVDKETDTRTQEADLNNPLSIIYNGAFANTTETILDLLKNKEGSIVLIDNDTDSDYDVAYVTAYENIVIGGVNLTDYIVYDKLNTSKSVTMDLEDENVSITLVDQDGSEVTFDSLKENDILSVAQSASLAGNVKRQIIKAIVSQETVEGVIAEKGQEDGKATLMIDDETYKLSSNYPATDAERLAVGDEVTLYLDAFGKVAYVKFGTSTEMSYGIAIELRAKTGVSQGLYMKVFTQEGAFEWIDLANKVTIDSLLVKQGDLVNANGEPATPSDPVKMEKIVYELKQAPQANLHNTGMFLMRYSKNSDGAINVIDTERKRDTTEGDFTLNPISVATSSTALQYRSSSKIVEFKYPINDNAVVFVLPTDATLLDDVKNLKAGKLSLMTNGSEYTVSSTTRNMHLSKLDPESIFADVVIIKQDAMKAFKVESATYDLPMIILDRITTYVDPDTGETFEKLYVMSEGAKKELIVSNELQWAWTGGAVQENQPGFKDKGYKRGDVFRAHLRDGKVANAQMLFEYNVTATSPGSYTTPTGTSDDYLKIIYGYVADREGDVLKIINLAAGETKFNPGETNPTFWDSDYWAVKVTSSFKITVYDPTKPEDQRLFTGKINDIRDYKYNPTNYSRVIVRYRSRGERDIIVLNDQPLRPSI